MWEITWGAKVGLWKDEYWGLEAMGNFNGQKWLQLVGGLTQSFWVYLWFQFRESEVEGQGLMIWSSCFHPSEQLGFEPETMCWPSGIQWKGLPLSWCSTHESFDCLNLRWCAGHLARMPQSWLILGIQWKSLPSSLLSWTWIVLSFEPEIMWTLLNGSPNLNPNS
jgi:hypothetical protein